MHSWETMMAPANHGHNWYNTMQIKPEPIDPGYQQHPQVNMNNSTGSPQTSPQSVDSMDSGGGQKQQLYFEQSMQSLAYNRSALGFNPLTPPGYTGLVAPQHQLPPRQTTPTRSFPAIEAGFNVPTSLTPTHTPPMDVTPPKSPKDRNQTPEKEMDTRSDCGDSYDDASIVSDLDDDVIKNPRVNSHGKVKTYKCKQCNFVAVTKLSFWDHTRSHIKPEKMLNCPKCPFVTEYKHHLEYHLRNHSRSKPFQCPSCNYSCVNKSMLNSHLKSHSSVFQYRCVDCNYATKYCHSLKLHLRKYSHKPDVVLNLDGSPNPLPIIDVYGTRRGPKTKSQMKQENAAARRDKEKDVQQRRLLKEQAMRLQKERELKAMQQEQLQVSLPQPPNGGNVLPSMMPNPLANMFQNAGPNMPLFSYFNLNFQMLAAQQQAAAMAQQLSPKLDESDKQSSNDRTAMNLSQSIRSDSNDYYMPEEEEGGVDKGFTDDDELTSNDAHTTVSTTGSKSRRKGRAFKIEQAAKPEEQPTGETKDRVESPTALTKEQQCQTTDTSAIATPKVFECKFCDITFKDDVIYTIHMGYHGYNDVFKCNMCGEKCDDRVAFFLHIARSSHQ